jgi:hypothetical protein
MSCCGRSRGAPAPPSPSPITPSGIASQTPSEVGFPFEYTGPTVLTVVGPFTGRIYRFEGTGSRLPIDPRDVPSMIGVPRLRRV